MEPVNFLCQIVKVQNMQSGGYRLTLDLPSTEREHAAVLMIYADGPGLNWQVEMKGIEQAEKGYGL